MLATRRLVFAWIQSPLLIVCVALGLRLAWLISYAPWHDAYERLIDRAPNPDSWSYHAVALVLLRFWNKPGQAIVEMPEAIGPITIRAPGYPLIIAVLYALFGVEPVWVVVAQVCASILNCSLVIVALRRICSPLSASLGGWLFAVNPALIDYTQLILTETFFVLGTTLALYSFARFRSQDNCSVMPSGFGSGITLALATLIRPGLLWLIPVLGILGIFARPLSAKARGLWLAGFVVGILTLFLPWAIYNRVHYGSWRLTIAGELYLLDMTGLAIAKMQKPIDQMRAVLEEEAFMRMRADGLDPNRQIFERGRYYRAVSLKYIRKHLYDFTYYWLRGMLFFWRSASGPNTGSEWLKSSRVIKLWFQVYHLAYLAVLGAGLWLSWRIRQQRWWTVVFLVTALYFTVSAGCSGNPRFRLQTFIFSLPVIAIGLDAISQRHKPIE